MTAVPAHCMTFSIRLLLCSAFLMNAGGFMVVPFLVIYLTQTLGLTAWELGTVLTSNLICARILPVVTGMIGDRASHSTTIVIGVLFRAVGFLGYGVFDQFGMLVVSSVFVGIGGALYDPSVNAVFASQPETWKKRIFTYYNQALNAGVVLGPVLGSLLVGRSATLPFVTGGSVLLGLSVFIFVFRKHYRTERTRSKMSETLGHVFKHKRFMTFVLAMVFFWVIFTQLSVSLPVQALRITQNEQLISLVFVVNGVTGILIMFALRKQYETRAPLLLVRLGVLCMSLGLFLMPLFSSLIWLIVCVLIYTVGETLVLPASDMAVSDFSSLQNLGAFFGVFEISIGIGGTIGNYLGSWLMQGENAILPWMVYGSIGIGMFLLILLLDRASRRS